MRSTYLHFCTMVLLCTSCGFLGEPPFQGDRVADVAPWQDVGPLTFCDGARRIGPRSGGALGACTKGPATTCTADADCKSRERCVCGQCALPVCDTADECGADRVCTFDERRCDRACTVDGDCAGGEVCAKGRNVCRGTCATSADCQTGESCQLSTGLCVAQTCSDDSTCAGGRRCAVERLPASLKEPSPLVAADGTQVTMWLERTEEAMDSVPMIWRAKSEDGFTFVFDPPRALLPGRAPTVARLSGGVRLIYEAPQGGTLLGATSTDADGTAFVTDAQPLLAQAAQPSLVQLAGGGFFALYAALPEGTSGGRSLARATSTDGKSFSPLEVVLTPADATDPVLWRDLDRLASPFAQVLRDPDGEPFVRLWFAGHGVESAPSMQFGAQIPTPPNDSIGEAAGYDGAHLQPYPFDPAFSRVVELLTHPSESDPAVISYGSGFILYYRRTAADGTNDDNLAWARSPALPPSD